MTTATAQELLDALHERLQALPATASFARLLRPYLRFAGKADQVVELLDVVAREWRAIREGESP
jgi:hypothetical protein